MEESAIVDKQGRLVVPSHIRDAMGLSEGGRVTIRLDGSRLILEPVPKEVRGRVKEWEKLALSLKAEAFTEETTEDWKWMSHEYARRKLGLS